MKLVKINPKTLKLSTKNFFRSSKKSRGDESLSKFDPPSFGSTGTTSSSSSSSASDLKAGIGSTTPQSVLPEISGDFSDFSADVFSSDLADAFRHMDRDNDGVVSRKELVALLSRLGSAQDGDFVTTMLSEVDDGVGSDGEISVEALVSRLAGLAAPASEPKGDSEMREVFEYFDTNRDGKISAEELLSFYAAIGDERCTLEDCRRMIESVDRFGDGFVCFEDFSRMMEMQRL